MTIFELFNIWEFQNFQCCHTTKGVVLFFTEDEHTTVCIFG